METSSDSVVSQEITNENESVDLLTSNITILSKPYSYWGFSTPLQLCWFLSITGTEYCHAYFWIIADLAWMQIWTEISIAMSSLAMLWSLLLLYHAMKSRNWHEIWHLVSLFLWLFANLW